MQAQLDLFARTLPARPLATDDFSRGLYRHPRIRALEKRYVQANGPSRCYWLPFDVDRPGAAHDWQLRDAPAPTLAVENPENLRAHLLYGLGVAVDKRPDGNGRALRYAAAVELALRRKLGADPAYAGLMVKNPLHPAWNVVAWAEELYHLADLAAYLDLGRAMDARRHLEDYGLSRNVELFNGLRRWAYRAIREADWPRIADWREACLRKAEAVNADFASPLPWAEVKATAKSVADWTHERMTPEAFSALQAERKRRDTERRRAEAEERRQGLLAFMETLPAGLSLRAVARMHGTSKSTAHRLLRVSHEPYQNYGPPPAQRRGKERSTGTGRSRPKARERARVTGKTGAPAAVHKNGHAAVPAEGTWPCFYCGRAGLRFRGVGPGGITRAWEPDGREHDCAGLQARRAGIAGATA